MNENFKRNAEFKEIFECYQQSKRFVEFASKDKGMLHDSAIMTEELQIRKKQMFNFECSMALLDDTLHEILTNEISNNNSMWYVGIISRSTFYRNRQKAIEIFLHNYHRLETLQ